MGAAMGRSYTERRRGRRTESRTRRRALGAGPPGPAGVPGPVDRRPGLQRRLLDAERGRGLAVGSEGGSAAQVALVQTAVSLPVVLLALPAGAAADVFDRRRLLLATQTWMLASAAALCLATVLGLASPAVVLALTFLLGLGNAANAPAWQATIPELVGGRLLAPAVALNSAGFNIGRAVGPALGGLVVAAAGPAAVFGLNAVSFLGVLAVLWRWRRRPQDELGAGERVLGAIGAG